MTPLSVALQRLANQHLTDPGLDDPAEIVRLLGAVQSQDYPAAKWALALRSRRASDAAIEQALDCGAIVRTHVLRPTWHFVAAEDIRWMLALTAPRVKAAMAGSNRRLSLDEAVFKRSRAVLAKVLGDGKQLTRAELAAALSKSRIDVSEPLRLAHLLMRAELDGLICSGARRGKQFTYALLDDRLPAVPALSRDDALAELAKRYFTTRGPATLNDFAWWSGLTVADAKKGVGLLDSQLRHEGIDGRTHWFADNMRPVKPRRRTAQLLPNYDEFFIGFKDRSAILQTTRALKVPAPVGAFYAHVIALNGQLVGGWRREVARDRLAIDLEYVALLTDAEKRLVTAAARKYASFLDLPMTLSQRHAAA